MYLHMAWRLSWLYNHDFQISMPVPSSEYDRFVPSVVLVGNIKPRVFLFLSPIYELTFFLTDVRFFFKLYYIVLSNFWHCFLINKPKIIHGLNSYRYLMLSSLSIFFLCKKSFHNSYIPCPHCMSVRLYLHIHSEKEIYGYR